MVRHKPDNIEWQKMQTRKRILQEWKKSFKVRLVFGHSKRRIEARKTFKRDLHVLIMFTLQAVWCYSGQRNFNFPLKKLNFFISPMQSSFSFAFKNRLSGKRGVKRNRCCWNKKETVQILSPTLQNLREKKKWFLCFLTHTWKFD